MKLNGSIELGPIVGLSEMIVDIVETGRTLKENKLAEVDSVFTATARLIANRASFKLKFARLHKLVEDLRIVLNEEDNKMQVTDARKMSAAEIAALMKKKAFDEVELSPRIQAGTDAMFGRHMTAAQVVDQIVADVRKNGDESLFYYTKLIDRVELTPENIRVTEEEFAEAEAIVKPEVKAALERAIANVMKFHEEQMPKTWLTNRPYGSLLGQKVTPVDSVGIYVPGGTAAYPSSVMMNACPAKVAGVPRIVMAVPPGKDGKVNPNVLVTAKLIGVTEIYKMGGAQAIAALAFGTATVPKVEKITGPGNIFVTLAKKAVIGHVDIDMLAGPSEILIVADDSANPLIWQQTF